MKVSKLSLTLLLKDYQCRNHRKVCPSLFAAMPPQNGNDNKPLLQRTGVSCWKVPVFLTRRSALYRGNFLSILVCPSRNMRDGTPTLDLPVRFGYDCQSGIWTESEEVSPFGSPPPLLEERALPSPTDDHPSESGTLLFLLREMSFQVVLFLHSQALPPFKKVRYPLSFLSFFSLGYVVPSHLKPNLYRESR